MEKEKFMRDIIELNNARLSEAGNAEALYKAIERLEADLKEAKRKFHDAIGAMQERDANILAFLLCAPTE